METLGRGLRQHILNVDAAMPAVFFAKRGAIEPRIELRRAVRIPASSDVRPAWY
jgi:hypothetical protein